MDVSRSSTFTAIAIASLVSGIDVFAAGTMWTNSSGGSHYGSAAAACKAIIEPGSFYVYSHTEPKPGDSTIAYCFSKPKDGKGSPSYIGVLSQVETPTTENLAKGNLGERLATECLAADGHTVVDAKPEIEGTNQGGIDIVTMNKGKVYFIDNKALTTSGNVSSVSALTTNFPQNKQAVLNKLNERLKDPGISDMEKKAFKDAVSAINSNNYVKAVTNANVAPDDKIPKGVTAKLAAQGIQFINVHEKDGCAK